MTTTTSEETMKTYDHTKTTTVLAKDVNTGVYLFDPLPQDVIDAGVMSRPIGRKRVNSFGKIEIAIYPPTSAKDGEVMIWMVFEPDAILQTSHFARLR